MSQLWHAEQGRLPAVHDGMKTKSALSTPEKALVGLRKEMVDFLRAAVSAAPGGRVMAAP